MKHTPGPWKITESANAIVVMGPNAQHVVIIPLFKEYAWSKEEWEGLNLEEKNKVSIANARLIAAAPELLEVIREAVDSAEREMAKGRKASPGLATWLEKARAALAKARADEGKENA